MTNNREREIREKLDCWYAGVSTPDEERRLMELFAATAALPADLEADRRLFFAIHDAEEKPVEMPAEYSVRIESALEAEIAREAMARRGSPRLWRRRLLAAGGFAACLLAAWFGFRAIVPEITKENEREHRANVEMPVKTNEQVAAVAPTAESQSESEQTESSSIATKPAPAPLASANAKKSVAHTVQSQQIKAQQVKAPEDYEYGNRGDVTAGWNEEEMYLSPEEEARLTAANYRVVDNEHEAYAIINSVFGRLEGNIARESYKTQDISMQYDMEVSKISY